jgi:hypothetical protein
LAIVAIQIQAQTNSFPTRLTNGQNRSATPAIARTNSLQPFSKIGLLGPLTKPPAGPFRKLGTNLFHIVHSEIKE